MAGRRGTPRLSLGGAQCCREDYKRENAEPVAAQIFALSRGHHLAPAHLLLLDRFEDSLDVVGVEDALLGLSHRSINLS